MKCTSLRFEDVLYVLCLLPNWLPDHRCLDPVLFGVGFGVGDRKEEVGRKSFLKIQLVLMHRCFDCFPKPKPDATN